MTEVKDRKWPADSVERWDIDKLINYARNSRKHSDAQVDMIAASMKEWGWTSPCLVDESGLIICGHGRVMAAKKLGFAQVPVMVAVGWSEAQKRAYVIADNQLSAASSWDDEMLKVELSDLKLEGFDLDLLGFGDQLTDLLDPDLVNPEKDPDEVPDVPVEPYSKMGDVWVMGPHRAMCGDSLSQSDWDKLMQGEMADLCVTDPPYGVKYESKLAGSIKNDDLSGAEFRDFLRTAFTCLFNVMKPGASIYVYHADTEGYNFRGAFIESGFHLSGCLIWKKNALVLGRSPYQWIHEPALFGFKKGKAHRFFGGRKQTTVTEFGEPFVRRDDGTWAIDVGGQTLIVSGDVLVEGVENSVIYADKPKRSAEHPTMKPTNLLIKNLKNSGRRNDIVVDAFGGSGSTMIAADMMGMCGRMMELDEKYVDVQCQRYYEWTGRVPVHAETGEPFPVKKASDVEVHQ